MEPFKWKNFMKKVCHYERWIKMKYYKLFWGKWKTLCKILGHLATNSAKLKMAKYFFYITRFSCKWIFSFATALACVFENSIPLNTTWLLDILFEFSSSTGMFALVLKNGFIFGFNYFIWEMIAIQGYLLAVDTLIGGLSLTFCLELAHR